MFAALLFLATQAACLDKGLVFYLFFAKEQYMKKVM